MLQVYIGLLVVAVGTMGLIGVYRAMNKRTEVVRDYADIRREGILRFVAEYERPGSYVAVDDTALQGFQYELSRAIARYAGLEMEMHFEMSLENSFDGLRDGRYDIVARNLPTTDELKADYFLTDPILTDRQVLVQRCDTARLLRNQLDLAGHTIVVPRESPAILRLENLRREMADTFRIVEDPLYSSEQLIAMVAAGDIDYTVCDRRVAAAALDPKSTSIPTSVSRNSMPGPSVGPHPCCAIASTLGLPACTPMAPSIASSGSITPPRTLRLTDRQLRRTA